MKPRYLRLRRLIWQWQGRSIEMGDDTRIDDSARILATEDEPVEMGRSCRIGVGVILDPRGGFIRMGNHCSVNPYCVLYGHGGLTIGNDVRIAAHVVIVPANHIFADRDRPIRVQGATREGIVIEDDVWIGAGARILDGVTIAKGCVIAAGAVLRESTAPYGVYAGVPARRVAERGDDPEAEASQV